MPHSPRLTFDPMDGPLDPCEANVCDCGEDEEEYEPDYEAILAQRDDGYWEGRI